MTEELLHYGTKFHSGRYPYGSGENPYQHIGLDGSSNTHGAVDGKEAYDRIKKLESAGKTLADISSDMGISQAKIRTIKSQFKSQERAELLAKADELMKNGYSRTAAAKELGVNESTLRSMGTDKARENIAAQENTCNLLKEKMKDGAWIDIGSGVNQELGLSEQRFKAAVKQLEDEGYITKTVPVEQITNMHNQTFMKIICPPGTDPDTIDANTLAEKTISITEHTTDGGKSWNTVKYPSSIDSSRVYVKYDEDGGTLLDGTIFIRRGVSDLSMGNSNYAQVRIAVDGKCYCKGMAIYSDDIPEGYDILVNSNKHRGTPLYSTDSSYKGETVLKKMKDNPNNPFGALIKAGGQTYYSDPNGQYIKKGDAYEEASAADKKNSSIEKFSLCAVNKIKEEGDWNEYSKTISSQMLSKQSLELMNKQLKMTYDDKESEFETIKGVKNPEVKKFLLEQFASSCDSSAVDLKATGFPGQTSKVILPVGTLKDTEVYAPTYKNGTKVALIRYPHGGQFEIPILTVNNNNAVGKTIVGASSPDAIGINTKVASILSGADFDGDSVTVIPISSAVNIKNMEPLAGLKDFSTMQYYDSAQNYKLMQKKNVQAEMGKISNLITDMTLKGATPDELERAVKHSMVVIDAEKHKLDYTRSFKENGIDELKTKYQGKANGGASTLISRSKSKAFTNEFKQIFNYSESNIDPETGALKRTETGRTKFKGYYKDGTPKIEMATTESKKMVEALQSGAGASSLSSGTDQEKIYAHYADSVYKLGCTARKEWLATGTSTVDASAAKTYAAEVASLKAKLNEALKNAPKEREAQRIARNEVNKVKTYFKDLSRQEYKDQMSKASQQALANARAKTGANKQSVLVKITSNEWDAIMANAINATTVRTILKNASAEDIKKLATPQSNGNQLTSHQQALIRNKLAMGFTIAEVADSMGISTSSVVKYGGNQS